MRGFLLWGFYFGVLAGRRLRLVRQILGPNDEDGCEARERTYLGAFY
jgi:hypothetical protein